MNVIQLIYYHNNDAFLQQFNVNLLRDTVHIGLIVKLHACEFINQVLALFLDLKIPIYNLYFK